MLNNLEFSRRNLTDLELSEEAKGSLNKLLFKDLIKHWLSKRSRARSIRNRPIGTACLSKVLCSKTRV